MSALIIALRAISLLVFAGLMLLVARRSTGLRTGAPHRGGGRAPVTANIAAFGLFISLLVMFSSTADTFTALVLAALGAVVALAGVALVHRSRIELGDAWSLVPKADETAGLITTGPYRHVRHPIYLGLTLLATGEAVAFASWPAALMVLSGIVPTFVWRARVEETLLSRTFGERYVRYRKQTKMIIPYLL